MFFNKVKNICYILIAASLLLFWNCSPKFSYEVKTILFDGVPNPYEIEITKVNDSLIKLDSLSAQGNSNIFVAKNEFNLHEPYQKRECSSCHDRSAMGTTKLPSPELCYECHENFNKTYEVLHGPVASGDCNGCHNPHQSKLDNLLIDTIDGLCLRCHDETLLHESEIHSKVKEDSCTKCHNAHGGNSSSILEKGSCYVCHDDFEQKFDFLHAPIASDNCTTCHESHNSTKPNLLINTFDKLCATCHSKDDFLNNEFHKKSKEKSCSKCHDAHGGSTKDFIFN